MSEIEHKCLRIHLIGDQYTGKTSIIDQFMEGVFSEEYIESYDVSINFKTMAIDRNKPRSLQIWDSSPNEGFIDSIKRLLKTTKYIILVYDISNRESFEHIRSWITYVKHFCIPSVSCYIAGNKSDLIGEREVTREEGEELAKLYNMDFFEVSAKTGSFIIELFTQIVKHSHTDRIPEHNF